MYQEIIYNIRGNKDLYLYLKYNSHLYKKIIRNEINLKELRQLQKESNGTKIQNIKEKIELLNTFLSILK